MSVGSYSRNPPITSLPVEVMPPAEHCALDKALNSTLHAVPSVSVIPLLLSLGVDHRKNSLISLVSGFETSIMALTFFKSTSYSLVKIVTCTPNWTTTRTCYSTYARTRSARHDPRLISVPSITSTYRVPRSQPDDSGPGTPSMDGSKSWTRLSPSRISAATRPWSVKGER